MKIINHRGQSRGDQTISQEIDVRAESNGELYLAHDLGRIGGGLDRFIRRWKEFRKEDSILALNIKQDGLAPLIKQAMIDLGISTDQYFCFDMSQPEILMYIRQGLPIATRISNYGVEKPLGDYIWFDRYPHLDDESCQHIMDDLENYIGQFGSEVINFDLIGVSPELHGENNPDIIRWTWEFFKANNFWAVCTDLEEQAEEYFNGDKGGAL